MPALTIQTNYCPTCQGQCEYPTKAAMPLVPSEERGRRAGRHPEPSWLPAVSLIDAREPRLRLHAVEALSPPIPRQALAYLIQHHFHSPNEHGDS